MEMRTAEDSSQYVQLSPASWWLETRVLLFCPYGIFNSQLFKKVSPLIVVAVCFSLSIVSTLKPTSRKYHCLRNSSWDPLYFRAMLCAGTLGLVTVVAMVGCAGASRGQHYTEVFSSSEDGQHVLVRARRSAEVCKYKKGEWSPCDTMVMVSTVIIHQ